MPGKDEKQNEQPNKQPNKQPNEYYFSYMERADGWLKEGFREAKFSRSRSKEFENLKKENAMKWIARAIAFAEIAEREGFKELSEDEDLDTDALDEEAKKRSEEIKNSAQFQAVIGSMSGEEIYHYLGRKEEGKKYPDQPIKFTEFAQKYAERKKELAREVEQEKRAQAQRQRMGDLVTDLENSTQKSIFGKIKSIFVGNSQQYKNALGAMKALSEGNVKSPQRMDKAKEAIKDYILARGGKERDHQYGRDRFDAFMKGLGEVMEPREFLQCCREVNKKREAAYGNPSHNIKPENYLQGEQLDTFKEEEAKILAAEKAALHKVSSTAKIRDEEQEKAHATNERREKIEELTAKEQNKTKSDAEKIRKDALSIAKGEKPSSNKTIPERDQDYLNMIRRVADSLKDPNAQMNINGLRKQIADRSEKHPAFRLVAQKLIRDKGLTDKFGYQETFTRKMDEDTLKGLEKQVNHLLEQDRVKHPDDPIKDVKVRDRAPKELQKLEKIQKDEDLENKRLEESTQTLNPKANQTKVEKQAGGDIGLGG